MLLTEDREQLHALAFEEQQAQLFVASPASTSLRQILEMSHRRFEWLVSGLAARDGLDVERRHGGPHDGGADVIATTPAGDRLVFQCKHTTKAKPVGVPTIRELNGTAGPVHNADIAIVITNGTFSKHAEEFARQQDIIRSAGGCLCAGPPGAHPCSTSSNSKNPVGWRRDHAASARGSRHKGVPRGRQEAPVEVVERWTDRRYGCTASV
ncbi:restriction endonuclease [Streptomyces avermitilis]